MNKSDVLAILRACPGDSPLRNVAKHAANQLERSSSFQLGGDQSNPQMQASQLLRTYERRLRRQQEQGMEINLGLGETVDLFKAKTGQLRTFYVRTDEELIYFWLDAQDQLSGIVIGKNDAHQEAIS